MLVAEMLILKWVFESGKGMTTNACGTISSRTRPKAEKMAAALTREFRRRCESAPRL